MFSEREGNIILSIIVIGLSAVLGAALTFLFSMIDLFFVIFKGQHLPFSIFWGMSPVPLIVILELLGCGLSKRIQ